MMKKHILSRQETPDTSYHDQCHAMSRNGITDELSYFMNNREI